MEKLMELTYETIAKRIDHSLLGPDPDRGRARSRAAAWPRAIAWRASASSRTAWPLAAAILRGTDVAVGTTIGFPHGGHATAVKVFEAERAIDDGATELDMVVNIGQVLGGDWDAVTTDIAAVTDGRPSARGDRQGDLRELLPERRPEDPALQDLRRGEGRLREDLDRLRHRRRDRRRPDPDARESPPHVKLKAAGGVRTLDGMIACARIGCDRIGASQTAEILDELKARLEGTGSRRGQHDAEPAMTRRKAATEAGFRSIVSTRSACPTMITSQRFTKRPVSKTPTICLSWCSRASGSSIGANWQSMIRWPPSVTNGDARRIGRRVVVGAEVAETALDVAEAEGAHLDGDRHLRSRGARRACRR